MYPQNNYNYYQPQQMYAQSQPMYQPASLLKGRPVSSIEEVKAANVDFDGSVFFYPDLAHKRIYTKQIGMDGNAMVLMYELKEIPTEQTTTVQEANYVTREEFEKVIQELKSSVAKQF